MSNTTFLNNQISGYKQKLITNSLLWSGLGFLLFAAICIGFSFIIQNSSLNIYDNGYYIGAGIFTFIGFIISMFLEMKWSTNIAGSSWGLVLLTVLLNILCYSMMIAPWIVFINDSWTVLSAFGITGGSMIILGLLGYFMSDKAAFTMMKVSMIMFAVFLILQLCYIFIMVFAWKSYQTWQIIYNSLFILFLIPYVLLSFYRISKSELFYNEIDDKSARTKIGIYFGHVILNQFIYLFYLLLRLFATLRG